MAFYQLFVTSVDQQVVDVDNCRCLCIYMHVFVQWKWKVGLFLPGSYISLDNGFFLIFDSLIRDFCCSVRSVSA